jgi:hypothetical protein
MEQIDEDDGLVRIFAQLIADRDSLVDQKLEGIDANQNTREES